MLDYNFNQYVIMHLFYTKIPSFFVFNFVLISFIFHL